MNLNEIFITTASAPAFLRPHPKHLTGSPLHLSEYEEGEEGREKKNIEYRSEKKYGRNV
jgi:hypothetical protein